MRKRFIFIKWKDNSNSNSTAVNGNINNLLFSLSLIWVKNKIMNSFRIQMLSQWCCLEFIFESHHKQFEPSHIIVKMITFCSATQTVGEMVYFFFSNTSFEAVLSWDILEEINAIQSLDQNHAFRSELLKCFIEFRYLVKQWFCVNPT